MRGKIAAALSGAALCAFVACAPLPPANRAGEDFASFCAGCHGADGRGMTAGKAPDLTTLSSKNSGTFPRLQVMGKIYGYTMGRSESQMPEFGQLLEGKSVPFDAGDGRITPTPQRLVDLALYLEALQK